MVRWLLPAAAILWIRLAQSGSRLHDRSRTPIDPSNLRRTTKTLCEAAKVDPVSPNELGRHTGASLLYDAGMSLDEIADLLDSSTRMLEAHYRHRVRDSFGRFVQHVEAIFGAG